MRKRAMEEKVKEKISKSKEVEAEEKKSEMDIIGEAGNTEDTSTQKEQAESGIEEVISQKEQAKSEAEEVISQKEQAKSEAEEVNPQKELAEPKAVETNPQNNPPASELPKESVQTDKQSEQGKELASVDKEPQYENKAAQQEVTDSTGRKRKKWPVIAAVCLFVLLIGIYGGIAFYYQTHFLPGTVINGIDCSGMEVEAVTALLDAQILDYSIEVTGRDYASGVTGTVLGTISATDIGLTYLATLETVEQVLYEQNQLLWAAALFPHEYSYDLVRGIAYDDELLGTVIKGWKACQKNNMIKAEDAYVSEYSDRLAGYEIIPETSGTELDIDQVIQTAAAAIEMQELSLDLDEAGLYKTAKVTQDDVGLTELVETVNRWLSTKIVYDWNGSEVILDLETLKDWVTIEDGEAVLDEDAVSSFVKAQASQYDTYGKNKKIVTALGVELTLRSPNYGWRTDTAGEKEELIALIKEGASGEREPVYLNMAVQKGMSDIGNSYVEADLTHQHLYVFEDGEIVLETDFVSGNMSSDPGSQTPQGIFALTYKTTNAVLRGRDYATPVSYWMPFYGNYGMHDATWRYVFGGDIYLTSGSHGCINLPLDMAAQIYQYVYTGSPVICYYYPASLDPLPAVPAEQVPEEQYDEE